MESRSSETFLPWVGDTFSENRSGTVTARGRPSGLDAPAPRCAEGVHGQLLTHRLTSQGQQASDHSEEDQHLGTAEGEEGQDEADHQDDEAAEERGGGGPSPRCEKKETAINEPSSQI